jgi:hypothetical protein
MELVSIKEAVKKEGVWFTPKSIEGKTLDISFCILGRNTEEYRRAIHKNIVGLSSSRKGVAEETIEKSTVEMLIACVIDWRGITVDGKEHPCTRENKKSLFEDASTKWLAEQIEAAINDDSLFLSVKE